MLRLRTPDTPSHSPKTDASPVRDHDDDLVQHAYLLIPDDE
jgi:hypothetical protein